MKGIKIEYTLDNPNWTDEEFGEVPVQETNFSLEEVIMIIETFRNIPQGCRIYEIESIQKI